LFALEEGETVIADRGYHAPCETPNHDVGDHFLKRQQGVARARHENMNARFKLFGCLNGTWRHARNVHKFAFFAIAIFVQLDLLYGRKLFDFVYREVESDDDE